MGLENRNLVLRQIEQQHFAVFRALDRHCFLITESSAITLLQLPAVQVDKAPGDLQPAVPVLTKVMRDLVTRLEQTDEQPRILANFHCPVLRIRRGNQAQLTLFFLGGKALLLVTCSRPFFSGRIQIW